MTASAVCHGKAQAARLWEALRTLLSGIWYQAALRDDAIHAAEHVSFLITALMFWTIVIEPSGRRRLGYGATFLFIATTAVLSAPPGALLALAQRPLYPAYADGAAAWRISQLEDQQLAGVVIWIPGGCVYLLAAAIVSFKMA